MHSPLLVSAAAAEAGHQVMNSLADMKIPTVHSEHRCQKEVGRRAMSDNYAEEERKQVSLVD